jgi:alpha-amylase/alpha-mannosidase (GH57 family)
MSQKPLCVALLWHMHQPDYSDAQTGEMYLPWTRLHAVKDYYDMGALAGETQGLHLTINVVPSLIDQLLAYAEGRARETCTTVTLKNASQLDDSEKAFMLRTFFHLSWKTMVFPYPRYRELLDRRGTADAKGEFPAGLRQYSAQDYRDLQMWYNLAWCGNELRRDPEILAMIRKGRAFSEQDKKRLLDLQSAFIGRILPLYRELMHNNGIELSVSPYYHPILPLLCDTHSAREALSNVPLPGEPFAYPADARAHIAGAQRRFAEVFGRAPQGMWPSEGSISDAALAIAQQAGIRWLASDEDVLAQSLHKLRHGAGPLTPEQKFSAHRWGNGQEGPCLFFRSHELSDLIGFSYSSWKAEDAASDFVHRLRLIREALPDTNRHYVVPVILDGENAWEHYPNNGADFLRSLYRKLAMSKDLRTVTCSEFLDLEPQRERLPSVLAGSWIYGNLATWIGHPEKNRGWDFLAKARAFLNESKDRPFAAAQIENGWREMMIAEGSDWFWWYGDDHQTENAAEFDALFRGHVKNVYRSLGQPYPGELDLPIKSVAVKTHYRSPVHTITPRLDGRVTDYFEWLSAGFATPGAGESMHRTRRYFDRLFFGYDAKRFFLRLDMEQSQLGNFPAHCAVRVQFVAPARYELLLSRAESGEWMCSANGGERSTAPPFAVDKIMEVGIPLETLGIHRSDEVRFCITLLDMGSEVERFPLNGFLAVPVDPWGLDQQDWIV